MLEIPELTEMAAESAVDLLEEYEFDSLIVPHLHDDGNVRLVELDANHDSAKKVLNNLMGVSHHDIDVGDHIQEARKSDDHQGVVSSVFQGLKNMVKKGLNFFNGKQDPKKMQNLILTDKAVLVPIESKSGTAMVVLDRNTETAHNLMNGLFKSVKQGAKNAKLSHLNAKNSAMAKLLHGVNSLTNASTIPQKKAAKKAKKFSNSK